MSRAGLGDIPYIDRNVEHVGVSHLRTLDGKKLRHVEKTLVIQEHNKPIAVLLSYEQYLIIQDKLQSVMETFEILASKDEMKLLRAGINDINSGKTRSIEDIRKSLQEEGVGH